MGNKVELRRVDESNWYDCCNLSLKSEQMEFIESNAISILQAKFEPSLELFSIYHNDELAGMLMYNTEFEELDSYWIYRIMIDEKLQGKGIGKVAGQMMIDKIKMLKDCKRITAGYHPDNTGSAKLFESLGFKDKGDRFGKEMAVVLDVE